MAYNNRDMNDDWEEQIQQQSVQPPHTLSIKIPSFITNFFSDRALRRKALTLAVFVLIGGFFFQMSRIENQQIGQVAGDSSLEDSEQIIEKIGSLIQLPNETPTVATVADVEQLKTQAFFANAQNGDKILLFPENKKAVLYRPSTNKVIEYAPINNGDQQGQTAGSSTSQPSSGSSGLETR